MDTKQLRDLMEAYSEVYAPEQLDEAYLSEIPTSTQMGGKPAQAARPQPRVMTAFDAGGGNARVRELMRQGIGGVEANRRVSTTGEYLQRQAATKADASRNRFPTGLAGRPAGSNPPARPAGSNPPARPAGSNPPARPAAAPTGGVAKPTAATSTAAKVAPTATEKPSAMDQWAKANPRLAQAQKIRQQGGSRAEVNKALYNKGTAAATSTPTVVKAGVDLFDIIKGHLLDEGFADTEEAALAIMTNMSVEWRSEILDELYKGKHGQSEKEYMAGRSDAGKRISGNEKEGPASYASRWHKGSEPTKPGQKPKNVQKLSKSEKEEIAYRKANLKKEETELEEATYSAKAARAGKDIGKPGKAFAKIAASAGKRYGSKERGEKVAGAVLAKLRAKGG